ncbi:MAG TPA: hypothetical protein VK462_08395, partial [Nitrososphaeraceae archaeon]|nr:hypothetical protein [Nitrososphaeraceae archaeon]
INLKTTDYVEIRRHTDVLVKAGFLGANFPKYHQPIYRGRVVRPDNVFHEVSKISYPPKSDPADQSFNRLSTNKFQVFYGAMMPQERRLDQITAMIEVGSILEKSFSGEEEYIQIGMWSVKEDFLIAILVLHSKLAGANQQVQKMKEIHTDLTRTFNEEGELIEIVAEFMSHELSKKVEKGKEYEYKISAAYGDALFEAGIKAIQFPSVKAEGRSFNIVLHKDLVDKAMDIEVAAITRLRKINAEIIVDWFLQSPIIADGKFKWEVPPRSAVTGEQEMKMIRENMARNDGKFVNPQG